MNEVFNALVELTRLLFGDAAAWAFGNGVSFAILGAVALALKFMGVM